MYESVASTLFRTVVRIPSIPHPIHVWHGSVFVGSCFAQHIGAKFQQYGLPALVNPLGTLYNPLSIAAVMEQALHPAPAPLVFPTPQGYYCWLSDTQHHAPTAAQMEEHIVGQLSDLRQAIARSRRLFVTLGTHVAYRHSALGCVVSNCLRQPQQLFEEEALGVEQCVEALGRIVDAARRMNPEVEVCFTVSPYRYAKYGFHRSQLSKATLLLAVDAVCQAQPECCQYFPSYEIQIDELRDYRFYNPDMLHPSPQAIDYIWQRLVEHWFDDEARRYLVAYEPIRRAMEHRPLHPDATADAERMALLEQQARALRAQYGITI